MSDDIEEFVQWAKDTVEKNMNARGKAVSTDHDELIRRLRELYRNTGAPSYKEAADALEAASLNERRYRERQADQATVE